MSLWCVNYFSMFVRYWHSENSFRLFPSDGVIFTSMTYLCQIGYVNINRCTLSRQIQRAFVCFLPIKHLQGVFSFVVFSGVEDLDPELLHAASRLGPLVQIDPPLSFTHHWKTRLFKIFQVFIQCFITAQLNSWMWLVRIFYNNISGKANHRFLLMCLS